MIAARVARTVVLVADDTSYRFFCRGNRTMKVVPCPGIDSTEIVPPNKLTTMSRAIGSPRPVPSLFLTEDRNDRRQ